MMLTSLGNGVGLPPYSSLASLLSHAKASIKRSTSAEEANVDDVTKEVEESAAKAEKALRVTLELGRFLNSYVWSGPFCDA